MRGGGELHRLERRDFTFGQEGESKFVEYHERYSKNGKATMTKFQPEHFRPGVKVFEADVVDTFERYYSHLPEGMTIFFLGPIDNLRTKAWYLRSPMGEKPLSLLVKQIFQDNGLDADEFNNKSGRTTLVTRMGEAGVPPEVGMLVTGHHSMQAYNRCDRSKEAKVKAAQRCAIERTLTYVQALQEETEKLRLTMIEGSTDESPPKRMKSSEEGVSSTKDSVELKLHGLNIETPGLPSQSDASGSARPGLTANNVRGKRMRKLEDMQDPSEWDWMANFDWESDLKGWEESKSVAINPISALLGKLVNCDGIVINFHGNVNFKS